MDPTWKSLVCRPLAMVLARKPHLANLGALKSPVLTAKANTVISMLELSMFNRPRLLSNNLGS